MKKCTLGFLVKYISVLLAILTVSSCIKDDEFDMDRMAENSFSPSIAIPLIKSRLKMSDILKDTTGIVKINKDNTIELNYKTDEINLKDNLNFIRLEDQETTTTQRIDIPQLPTRSLEQEFELEFDLNFGDPSISLDSLIFGKGELTFSIGTNAELDIENEVSFENLLSERKTKLVSNLNLENGQPKEANISLKDKRFVSLEDKGNKIIVKVKMNIKDLTGFTEPFIDLTLKLGIKDFDYETVFGYFGKKEFTFSEEAKINMFNNVFKGSIKFEEVNFSLDIASSVGVPAKLTFEELTTKGKTKIHNVTDILSTYEIDAPDNTQVGDTIHTIAANNIASPQLTDALLDTPQEIKFKFNAALNPDDDKTKSNFITKTSGIEVTPSINIPLFGTISDFQIRDTLNFSIGDIGEIQTLAIRINTLNAFPMDVKMQLVFTDSLYNEIDTLFEDEELVLVSGIVDPKQDYKVIEPKSFMKDVVIEEERVAILKKAKYAILIAKLQSFDHENNPIKINNSSYIDLKLGIKSKINVEEN
ncbi:MAG: hypothetical protein ACEPOV_01915 [Hyphomicrobiales bacterium]